MEIFKDYYENLIHSEKCKYTHTSATHAVVKWSVDETPKNTLIKTNKTGQHVEHVVLEEMFRIINIEKKKEAGKVKHQMKVDVKLYMNYSPCHFTKCNSPGPTEAADIDWPEDGLTCCEALIAFMQRKDITLTLQVVFVSLYKIGRQSCFDKCCPAGTNWHFTESGHQEESNINKQGLENVVEECLRNVADRKCELRTFSPEDWEDLRTELKVEQEDKGYKELLKRLPMKLRKTEDKRMKEDLEAIVARVPKPEDKRTTAKHPGASVPKPENKRTTAEHPDAEIEALGDGVADIGLGGNHAGGANQ